MTGAVSATACQVAHAVWAAWSAPRTRRFERALRDPEAAQWRVLESVLRHNRDSAFGRRHGFASIGSVEAYRRRVPLVDYDGLAPWIDRIRSGEGGVLTTDRVRRLVPSSGSTSACKLIPWTRSFGAEWSRAIQPWIHDLLRRRPEVKGGPAYWSVSPALGVGEEEAPSAVPVGFDEDSAYLGRVLRPLVRSTLAVPEEIRHVRGPEAFRYLTALGLVRAADLRFVSVWHPSFLELALDAVERYWPALLRDVARGTVTPPSPRADGPAASTRDARSTWDASTVRSELRPWLRPWLRPDPERARALGQVGPAGWAAIWPRLALVSCWADGPSEGPAGALRERLDGVRVQPKGLLATEGVVTIPFAGARPVAVRSHFFEFVDDGGTPRVAADLREGETYGAVLTTGAGLYRYRLGDRVRVEGLVGRTPCLRFVGREDHVSDLRGEKLSGAFVAEVLERVLEAPPPPFAMLAPDPAPAGRLPGYTLYVESPDPLPGDLPRRLDDALSANPHYRYARRLGQLRRPAIFRVGPGGRTTYLEREGARGRRVGSVKPPALSLLDDWSRHLAGDYEPRARAEALSGEGRPG